MCSQMILKRFFYCSSSLYSVEKSLLASLRKKTGYTFSNCKKALELNENDLQKAEHWLQKQAQALGWSKANKLEGRKTAQGLIAGKAEDRHAVLVEVNCETDFVGRNANFQEMVKTTAQTLFDFAKSQPLGNHSLMKVQYDTKQLQEMCTSDGKKLSDELALMIGQVGENASLKRGLCYKVEKDVHLSVYVHPSGTVRNGISLGKFGGVLALRKINDTPADIEKLGNYLCQHIVGMNPEKLGTPEDKPADNIDDEKCLIYQEFLLDDEWIVGDLLNANGIEIIDFKRYGCGEEDSNPQINDSQERLLSTCQ